MGDVAMAACLPGQLFAVEAVRTVREIHPILTANGRAIEHRPASVSLTSLILIQEEIVGFFARVQDFAVRDVKACCQLNGAGKGHGGIRGESLF